ncbi:MAG TPA: FAD-binding protein, partial [Firmicutes bacterium]|nr:FAD-binding protein [Bacillota bacterium]
EEKVIYDTIIIGGGPAGMNAALYAARKGLKTGIITFDIGGQVLNTSEVENYIGTPSILGPDMADAWKNHMLRYNVEVYEFVHAEKIEKKDRFFKVHTDDGKVFTSRTLILATGKRSRPMDVPGEKEFTGRGVAYCATCDAPLYGGKTVAVVGGGNSAIEAIVDLGKIAKKIYVFQFLEDFTADKAVQEKIDPYREKMEIYFNTMVARCEGDTKLTHAVIRNRLSGEEKTISLDGLFVEIGLIPNTEFLKGFVELNKHGEIVVDKHGATSVEGVFAAGDVTDVPFKQIVIAAGEGARAALAASEYLLSH